MEFRLGNHFFIFRNVDVSDKCVDKNVLSYFYKYDRFNLFLSYHFSAKTLK